MMVLDHKFTIFFLFIIIYLAKTEDIGYVGPNYVLKTTPRGLEDPETGRPYVNNPPNHPNYPVEHRNIQYIPPTNPPIDPPTRPNPPVDPPTRPNPPVDPPSFPPVPKTPAFPCAQHSHVFSFSNVGLQKIGPDFIKSSDIISLYIDNNNINNVSPYAFRNTQNLKYLDLSGNRIPKEKLLQLARINNLQTLIINNNQDSHSPDTDTMKEYGTFPNLKTLHLSNSQLRNFQVHFHLAMPNLIYLYLNNNSISSDDAIFENIPITLTHLHLNNNSITQVKQGKLRYLREFSMDDNVITQICYENCEDTSISLKGAFEMQNLSLSGNQISEITIDAFTDARGLSLLDLSGNKIADVAKGTFNNTNYINTLSLANNVLGVVPDVCPVYYLVNLDLSGNRIGAIHSNAFCAHLRNTLEYLYLSDNIITIIEPRAFQSLDKLKYLDLSGNRLRQLPTHWLSWYVEELHLERNNFTDLDHIPLSNVKMLGNVYLDGNPMPTLKANSFNVLPGHLRVHLKNVRVEECAPCQCDNDNDNDYDINDDNYGNFGSPD
ncbi:leucine-rich repeat-containing protein let-4 [Monomorium pharaonis]|uniref:leucine-rich repeat-containing protein let-4 n=1 Tax=Monomorium pharaonis TaxID=307658 RepID=UPI00063FB2A7|nr:leucine-rich repeat-containing protein let-4 [Monomorium pharaonis]